MSFLRISGSVAFSPKSLHDFQFYDNPAMKPSFGKVFIADALEYKTLELLCIRHFFAEDQKATEVSRIILLPHPPPHTPPDQTPLGRAGPGERIDLPPPVGQVPVISPQVEPVLVEKKTFRNFNR